MKYQDGSYRKIKIPEIPGFVWMLIVPVLTTLGSLGVASVLNDQITSQSSSWASIGTSSEQVLSSSVGMLPFAIMLGVIVGIIHLLTGIMRD